jgi:hypothetical protein
MAPKELSLIQKAAGKLGHECAKSGSGMLLYFNRLK